MSTEYIPYCYLIGWSKLDTWYYGVEYANNNQRVANPGNLWKTYFTSSKHVGAFVYMHGAPDVIQIRKTFTARDKAQLWECTVLRRLKVREKSSWLNVNPGGFGFSCPTGELHPCFGKKRSEKSNQKQSETRRQRHTQGKYSYYKHSPEHLEKVRQLGRSNAKPKEQRTYTCLACGNVVEKTEYAHHPIKQDYRCGCWKPGAPAKHVIMFGVRYDSVLHAATELKMSKDKIRHRLSSEKFPDCTKLLPENSALSQSDHQTSHLL